jgi:glutathione synthase
MLMRETSARGHDAAWCHPNDLYVLSGQAHARVQSVHTPAGAPRFERGAWRDEPVGAFDVVWMRKDPPFDMEYIFSTYLLEKVPPTTLVLNKPASIRSRNEKLFANEFVEFTPPTLVSRDAARVAAFAAAAPDRVVLKPWDGNGGRGVLVAQKGDRNLRAMVELLTQEGRIALIAQHYLPAIAEGDKRILLVDGAPVGAMLRVPGTDDHRGNMHVGASVQKTTLTDADRRICNAIGPRLKAEGLLFVGIDVIGGFLTEINVTSPTGIQEINRLDGVRIEAQVVDATEARLAALRSLA